MKRNVLSAGAALTVVAAAALAGMLAFAPAPGRAASSRPTAAQLGGCPRDIQPLPADAVARAADQARIQAPYLYRERGYQGRGPAMVELSWLAKFRLNVWAATPFHCSNQVRDRTVVVDLLFPRMLPGTSVSRGVVLVSLFDTGYRVWEVAH
jgi:hypothetical protein